jgi:hypothetical protein
VPELTPELLDTYKTNVLRITDPYDIEDTIWEVRPGTAGAGPDIDVMQVIPAWNPDGRPVGSGENGALRENLEIDVLGADGGHFAVGAAHDPDYAWVEEALIVRDISDEEAARVAAGHGQPALWRWDGHVLTVLRSGDGRALASVRTSARSLASRPCVRPHNQPDPAQPCVRPGGPWTGRSIEVAAEWTRDRYVLLGVLGCDICDHGMLPAGQGHPRLLHQWSAASRYAPAHILRELTDEEFRLQ